MAKEIINIGTTPGGKEINFVRAGSIGKIQFGDGGELPKELQGGFTDQQNAQTAVASYLARMAQEKKKAETIYKAK